MRSEKASQERRYLNWSPEGGGKAFQVEGTTWEGKDVVGSGEERQGQACSHSSGTLTRHGCGRWASESEKNWDHYPHLTDGKAESRFPTGLLSGIAGVKLPDSRGRTQTSELHYPRVIADTRESRAGVDQAVREHGIGNQKVPSRSLLPLICQQLLPFSTTGCCGAKEMTEEPALG